MSTIRIIAPHEDLLRAVLGELPPGEKDYSGTCIVFPGKRPAHFLRKRIAERERTSYLPPAIFPIEAFVQYVYSNYCENAGRECGEMDALAILYEIHRRTGGTAGDGSPDSLETFLPAGRKILAEMEELVLAECTVQQLRRVLQGTGYPRFRILAEYYESFYDTLAQRGYATRAVMYREAATSIGRLDAERYNRIILAGFYALTKSEQKLFSGLARMRNVTLLFQNGEGLNEKLAAYNFHCDVPDIGSAAGPELRFTRSPDTHGQIMALAAELGRQIRTSGAPPDEHTAIVLPSSGALFPIIHNALPLLPPDKYNIALGYPITRTPIYGFLSCLMDLAESMQDGLVSPGEYLKFVLHPYTKNIRLGHSSEITRIMFHEMEDHLIGNRAGALVALTELESDEPFFSGLAERLSPVFPEITPAVLRGHLRSIHDRTIRRFSTVTSCGDFAARAIGVLTDIFDHSTARLHPFSRRYAERLNEILESLRASLLADHAFDDLPGYFSFFRELAGAETVPFPGTPLIGLQVLGLLETRNIAFDTLYVLDAEDDVLPGSPADDYLLPYPVRKELGLETYADREQLVAYYLNLAVRNAAKVHFFYAEGGGKEKSRFVQKLIWQLQKRDRTVSATPYEMTVKYNVRLANARPAAVPKTPAMIRYLRSLRFSSFALDTYLRCPLRFYYYYVLDLQEKEDMSDELDPLRVGTIIHEILSEYYGELVGRELRRDMFGNQKLERIIDTSFQKRFGNNLTGTAWLLRRQIASHLGEYFERLQIPLVEKHRIVIKGIERSYFAGKNGYQFAGRIDRVELRDTMNVILDYKTGKDTTAPVRPEKLSAEDPATWPEAIRSFQLPLYMLLYAEHTGTGIGAITPLYLLLGRKNLDSKAERGIDVGEQTPEMIYRTVEPVIFSLLNRLTDLTVPFEPTLKPEKECPACPFKIICGTQWVQGWNEG